MGGPSLLWDERCSESLGRLAVVLDMFSIIRIQLLCPGLEDDKVILVDRECAELLLLTCGFLHGVVRYLREWVCLAPLVDNHLHSHDLIVEVDQGLRAVNDELDTRVITEFLVLLFQLELAPPEARDDAACGDVLVAVRAGVHQVWLRAKFADQVQP